ncbi:hypothetical protein BDZ97DRAFT_1800056 [Flammula alnicola]|nr:hypothetical protein BDZ97DRAFT_1800056 [Flammula alnicola]
MFMPTTSPEHHRAVEHVWRQLNAKGYIYKGHYSGWSSVIDECFYTDSQVFAVPLTTTTTTTPLACSIPQPRRVCSLRRLCQVRIWTCWPFI